MRYRPAKSVPGKNRLSRKDVDDGLLAPADCPPLPGDRGVVGRTAATVRVAYSPSITFSPQAEQKRTFSPISVPQEVHFAMDVFYTR